MSRPSMMDRWPTIDQWAALDRRQQVETAQDLLQEALERRAHDGPGVLSLNVRMGLDLLNEAMADPCPDCEQRKLEDKIRSEGSQ